MAKVEGDGCEAERLGVNFGVGQAGGPLGQVVEREPERMKNGAARGGNAGVRATEPGLGVRDGRGELLIAVV